MTHAELVIEYLRANRGDVISIADIRTGTGLNKRQVSRTMSTLTDRLGDAITKVGTGLWVYEPARRAIGGPTNGEAIYRYDQPYGDTGDDLDVPLGWQTTVTVVGKVTFSGGERWYTLQTATGLLLFCQQISHIESTYRGVGITGPSATLPDGNTPDTG